MSLAFNVDVQQVGLDEMREYPELGELSSSPRCGVGAHALRLIPVPACGWASVHVSMNILLFLIKLNFR